MAVAIAGASRFVYANGLRHHVLSYGTADDPAVLVLPGITSPAATADFIASRIAGLGYSVHVPDYRGRGGSDRALSGGYRLVDYADDVGGLVAALGLRRPILIGHSLGARIAAYYATSAAAGDHALVVLVDPPLSGPGRGPYPTPWSSFLAQLSEAKVGTTADEVRRFYPKWTERELQIRAEVLAGCDETAIRETYLGFETEDFFPIWRKVDCPAMLIYGEESPVVTAAGLAELKAANPDIPCYGVASAGHMVPWDNTEGFFELLTPIFLETRRLTTRDT